MDNYHCFVAQFSVYWQPVGSSSLLASAKSTERKIIQWRGYFQETCR